MCVTSLLGFFMKICQSCLQFCFKICVAHFSKVDDIIDMAKQQIFYHRRLPQVIQGIRSCHTGVASDQLL